MGGIDGLPPNEGFEKVVFPRVANRQAFVPMQVLIAIDMYKEHTMRPTNKLVITFSPNENLLLYSFNKRVACSPNHAVQRSTII